MWSNISKEPNVERKKGNRFENATRCVLNVRLVHTSLHTLSYREEYVYDKYYQEHRKLEVSHSLNSIDTRWPYCCCCWYYFPLCRFDLSSVGFNNASPLFLPPWFEYNAFLSLDGPCTFESVSLAGNAKHWHSLDCCDKLVFRLQTSASDSCFCPHVVSFTIYIPTIPMPSLRGMKSNPFYSLLNGDMKEACLKCSRTRVRLLPHSNIVCLSHAQNDTEQLSSCIHDL